jgi:hypothetical protein
MSQAIDSLSWQEAGAALQQDAGVLARSTGANDYTRWVGQSAVLTPGKANGQDTITISGVPISTEQAA